MSVICFGELLIDFVSSESGVTVEQASGFVKAPGGAPANVAVGVARLGHPAAFLGQVGEDPFGHFLADVLESESVDVSGVCFHPDARTALAFVALDTGGERSFVFYRNPSADMLMTPADVNTDIIRKGKIFHFGSITLIHEPSASATRHALQTAQDSGLLISYDPNLRMALWPDEDSAREGILSGFDHAHIIKISDDELHFLTGNSNIGALWREQTRLIIITHGSGGATAYTSPDEGVHVAGLPVQAIDTTGAGDSFVAGLLVGILENPNNYLNQLKPILRFANACGALTTTQRGAIPALPLREQVAEML
jgi:fructokinase